MKTAKWFGVSVVLLCTASLLAEERTAACSRTDRNDKQPWEWTVEERLAKRFDAIDARERRAAYEDTHRAQLRAAAADLESVSFADESASGAIHQSIDGRRNPELFLPHELFESLMSGLQPDAQRRAAQRQFYAPAIRAAGYDPETFWSRLAEVAQAYANVRYESSGATAAMSRRQRCAERHHALEAARRAFGQDLFERFLYTVIAPTKQKASVTVGVDPADELRQAETGCA